MNKGKLVFFCGKMGAGKTTKSIELKHKLNAVLFCEDAWLESMYPDAINTIQDYVKYSNRIKPIIKSTVQNILSVGTNVVMDFPGNTISQRSWFKDLYTEIEATHELMFIDVPDALCLQQIAKRRTEQGQSLATDTEEMFYAMLKYFEPPVNSEGFNVTRVGKNEI